MKNQLIAGVDEVGRGSIAGDLFAASVILKDNQSLEGIDDSKKLTAARREYYAKKLQRDSLCWGLGRASIAEIEELNVLQASLLAMRRAVENMPLSPDLVLVDGPYLPDWNYPSRPIIKGDTKVACIAASSIIAKVARDAYMRQQGLHYKLYYFEKNKGYLTRQHHQMITKYGPCPLHRRTFEPIKSLCR